MGFQIIYSPLFRKEFRKLFECNEDYYSQQTLKKLTEQLLHIREELREHPYIGAPEPLLITEVPLFRRIVIKPYFKLIYFVDNNNIVLSDIWDTRRNPDNLSNRVTTSF